MLFRFRLILLAAGVALLSAAAATDGANAGELLRYVGATTLQRNFMPEAARRFERQTGAVFSINGGNTDPGLRAILADEADIAGSGRFLTAEEKAAGLVEILIGWDALAVVTHATNPIDNLSLAQLRRILLGKTINWREIGGRDLPIILITSPAGSGMRTAVENLILGEGKISGQAIISLVVADADQQVAQLPAGLTVISKSMIDVPNTKIIRIDGYLPTDETMRQKQYPLVKPLLLVTKGSPVGIKAKFIEFVKSSEGQALLSNNYFPLY